MVSVLDGYVPRAADPAAWQAVEPAVRDLLDGLPASVAAKARFPLATFALWLHEQGHHRLSAALLLDEAQQAPWLTQVRSTRSAATYRSALRALAAARDPARAAVRQTLTDPTAPSVYTPAHVQAMLDHAAHLPTKLQRVAATALVVLGAGAGLDGRDLSGLTGADVVRRQDGLVVVNVAGSRRPRTVAVLARYADRAVEVARAGQDLRPGLPLVGRTSSARSVTEFATATFRGWGGPAVSASSLRATWLATHLAAGTRLPVLLAQAGTDTLRTVETIAVALVADLDTDQAMREAAGALS